MSKKERAKVFLQGQYAACVALTTSPRMNRPQLDVIEEMAHRIQDRLRTEHGVEFEFVVKEKA